MQPWKRVRQGVKIVIEQDHQPVAIITTAQFRGRDIDDCIAALQAHGSNAIPDQDFGNDIQAAIEAHREPLDPPSWG